MMRDLYDGDLPTLSRELTAANFGHISPEARREDIALGLVTMILQSAGLAASFTLRGKEVRDVVLTGALTQLPQAEEQFAFMSRCFDLNFRIPGELAPYATALGPVLCPPQACNLAAVMTKASEYAQPPDGPDRPGAASVSRNLLGPQTGRNLTQGGFCHAIGQSSHDLFIFGQYDKDKSETIRKGSPRVQEVKKPKKPLISITLWCCWC